MYRAKVTITLRKSILDPQGKAIQHALDSLELKQVEEVRMGKFIEMNINVSEEKRAKEIAELACKKLLANTVMEDYSYSVEKI